MDSDVEKGKQRADDIAAHHFSIHADLTSSRSPNTNAAPYRPFPPSFDVHLKKNPFSMTFHLGESASSRLFAVKAPGWRTKSLVLHNGPKTSDPPLASACDAADKYSFDAVITLWPSPGGSPADGPDVVELRATDSPRSATAEYYFATEVGCGDGPLRRENFVWRPLRGEEVKGFTTLNQWWKLVRLQPRGEPREEVVAYWWRDSGVSSFQGHRFQFSGSGLTGELGQRWTVVAVITALRVWYRKALYQTVMGTY